MKSASQFKRLEDRLSGYGPDVALVIRKVLFEEQRKLALRSPRDITSFIEKTVEEAAENGRLGDAGVEQ